MPETSERAQRELALQIALGSALIATKGQADSDVQHAYARARQLCQYIEQSPQLSPAQHGLWRFYYVRAELQTARALAEEAFTLAPQAEDPVLFMAAHHALGSTLLVLGELPPAPAPT